MKKDPTNADRQRAHRQRTKERLAGLLPTEPRQKRPKKTNRRERLAVIRRDLQPLLDEHEVWLEAMPPNLADSDLAQRLQDTIDLLQAALDALDEVDPPRGFGR